ncbi:hypothetical protein [Mycoplasma procyoni]|uniref:hypothetical protein n=1 Tax=Mycoplasma procyoni TaxID=568784 RepID=UPI00197C90FB|nr:hypothetical protein [Mycoplasma procyoni]MBN3535000.1 hypothetical protein [Mycoplasma procyoni]
MQIYGKSDALFLGVKGGNRGDDNKIFTLKEGITKEDLESTASGGSKNSIYFEAEKNEENHTLTIKYKNKKTKKEYTQTFTLN